MTNEIAGRMAHLCGGLVISSLLIAAGDVTPMEHPRLFVAAARAATDDPGTATPTPPPPAEDPRNGVARLAPHLEAVEPLGNSVRVDAPIVISFSQPMARASVEHSFAIRPRADGRLLWLDDFTLRFEPIMLAHGQVYEVQVGGRSVRGAPLAHQGSWQFTTVAAPPKVLLPGPTVIRVPILMYHYIRLNPDPKDRLGFALSITPADFAAQMDWLAGNGYHPITFEDLQAYLGGQRGLPSRPVILTFDDGYADFYTTALPILRAHDFSAVAYVVSGFMGRSGYLTPAQVSEADRSGIQIGAHTVDHVNLATQSRGGMRFQVNASKEALEHLLGHAVLSFCYPSGRFDAAVVAAVQAAGYRDATTTSYGSVRSLADRYLWGRLRVSGGESLDQFASALLKAS